MSMVVACLAMTAANTAPGNQDAATQVQEGDVGQWIEYYKKERNQSNEPVTDKKALPDSSQSDAGRKSEAKRS